MYLHSDTGFLEANKFQREPPPTHKVQIRAKRDLKKYALKFAPVGGVIIPHLKEEKDKFTKEVKKHANLHECYIRAVTADVHAVAKYSNSDDPRPGVEFSIVSPLGCLLYTSPSPRDS